jgi:hypothetical protein
MTRENYNRLREYRFGSYCGNCSNCLRAKENGVTNLRCKEMINKNVDNTLIGLCSVCNTWKSEKDKKNG